MSRHLNLLVRREWGSFFKSPLGYLVLFFFFSLMGFSFWFQTELLLEGLPAVAFLRSFFGGYLFWMCMLLTVPLITMRSFAEERRAGTIETLLTTPVKEQVVVLAKFLGAWFFFAVMWLLPVLYVLVVSRYNPDQQWVDPRVLGLAYGGTLCIGSFFVAVGIFCSSLVRHQLVAAMASLFLLTTFFLLGLLPFLLTDGIAVSLSRYISPVLHMRTMATGGLDSRIFVFYISGAWLFLTATTLLLKVRRAV